MTEYSSLSSPLQELRDMLREFQKHLKTIRELSNLLGSREDTTSLRSRLHQEQETGLLLSKQLFDAAKVKPSTRVDRVQHESLVKQFHQLLEEYNKLTTATLEKERSIQTAIRESIETEEIKRAGIVQSEEGMGNQTVQRKSSIFKELGSFDEAVLKERQEEIQLLEKDMLAANNLFKDVSALVQEQGVMLSEVDELVNVAVDETGKAVEQLDKAETYQKKSRSKLIWIIICTLVLIGVVVVVVVVLKR